MLPGIALTAILVARPASAQSPAPVSGDTAAADALFSEAKQRMANGDFAGACPKLAESYHLDPGTGTLTALAVCHEHIGKTATAWSEFVEVASSAQRQGRSDREAFARQRIAVLEPLLSRLTIQVRPDTARIPKLQVRRDGVAVAPAAWGVAVPVDPGEHVVEATAPEREEWSGRVVVDASADKKEISIPPLPNVAPMSTPAPVEEPAPPPSIPIATTETGPDHAHGSSAGTVGLVVGGTGILSMAIGTYFGASALSKSSDAKRQCPSSPCSNQSAVNEDGDAKSAALIADITFGVGIAALGVGAFLFLTAPKGSAVPAESPPPAAAWRLVPSVSLRGAGLALQATY